jgi:hypothetical protein
MRQLRRRWLTAVTLATMAGQLGTLPAIEAKNGEDDQRDSAKHGGSNSQTESPIKHVIVLIGENRTFDNVYGTYQPVKGQHVANLLSRGIVKADGSPGPHSAAAKQFQLETIDPPDFFISTRQLNNPGKSAYPVLPTPEAGFAPPQVETLTQFLNAPAPSATPFDPRTFSLNMLGQFTAGLSTANLPLLTTGATGLDNCQSDPTLPPFACPEPDTRIPHYASLPNTMFELGGPRLPYDSYTGDMVHRFFHMWQQSDCDVLNATADNPSGCLNDLYPFVGIARGDDSGSNAMGFYNVQRGHAPLFKWLADQTQGTGDRMRRSPRPIRPALVHVLLVPMLVVTAMAGLFMTRRLTAAATFTPGNLALLVAAASANNTTASIVEINTTTASQGAIQVIATPDVASADSYRISGSATSTGYLSLSNDRSLLAFNGANSTTTGANVNTLNPRAVYTVSGGGTVVKQTTYTGSSGNQTRSATSVDNAIWYISDQGGLYTNGASAASPAGNFRAAKSFGGTVYLSQTSSLAATVQVVTASAPAGGSITGLPGLTNNASLQTSTSCSRAITAPPTTSSTS